MPGRRAASFAQTTPRDTLLLRGPARVAGCRVLLGRRISADERHALADRATQLGLGAADAARLHRTYMGRLLVAPVVEALLAEARARAGAGVGDAGDSGDGVGGGGADAGAGPGTEGSGVRDLGGG